MRESLRAHLRAIGVQPRGSLFAPAPDDGDLRGRVQALLDAVAAPLQVPAVAPAMLGACYESLLTFGQRKRAGAWFTGDALVRPTVERTLLPLLAGDAAALRIVDPAVGGGAFLVAALQFLSGRSDQPPARIACEQLHGVDTDPTAAAIAAWAVWEAAGEPQLDVVAIERNVHAGDGLFAFADGSFDAVLGNPPWETLQPSSKEFFAEVDAGYRALGKQAALARQRQLFAAAPAVAAEWQAAQATGSAYVARLRAAFAHQGRGKLYTYRLFVERAHRLLRDGGRLGLIVPASLYFDRDAAPLRRLLLDHCQWEWLFAFENRRRIFPIDRRYRFGPIVVQKGGRTTAVRAAFLRQDPAEWAGRAPPHLHYRRASIDALSPRHGVLFELCDERDLALLTRLQQGGAPLLAPAGPLRFRQGDFNMTSDSAQFTARAALEAAGYRAGADACWRRREGSPEYLPLYQGAMVYDLHPNAAGHQSGAGHRTRWAPLALDADLPQPQFLVDAARWRANREARAPARVVLRALSNASNERTLVPCLLPDVPCGNSLVVLSPVATEPTPLRSCAIATGVLGSLVCDWAVRQRLAGTNLNRFVLEELVGPRLSAADGTPIALLVLRLCAVLPWQQSLWQLAGDEGWLPRGVTFARAAARQPGARRQLRIELDVAIAHAFGLDGADLAWLLRDCHRQPAALRAGRQPRGLDPKGFWRLDQELPPPQRHTLRVLAAMRSEAREVVRSAPAGS